MKKFFKEFKDFAMKGNVLDLAIGIMIGAAFGKIVTSLVNDILTPIIGLLLGGVNFSNLFIQLGGDVAYPSLEAAKEAGVGTLNYGMFIQSIFDFLIIALCIFSVLKAINKFLIKKKEEAPAKPVRLCEFCFCEVHDEATRCPHCTSEIKKA